jgi:tetratricopeptide (TPR) repeat protein
VAILAARRSDALVRRSFRRDPAAAETLLRDALREAERSRQARAIAHASQFLYFLLRDQDRHAEAAEVLERKVRAHRQLDGADGRWTAEWSNELISLYGQIGRVERLEPLCRERLASALRRDGPNGIEVACALVTLAWALRLARRWDESEACCRRALHLVEEAFGTDHPRTGWPLMGLAHVQRHRGELAEAEATLERARRNWQAAGHADRVAAVEELLVEVYQAQGRQEDALDLSTRWLARLERRPGAGDERQPERLERHAGVLRAAGAEAEAVRCETRAAELRGAIERRCREQAAARPAEEPDTPRTQSPGDVRALGPLFPSPLL